ncbi:MAG: hypothetical protein HY280_05645 [Nitrospinae bacterium]|nr:hypothetical protein [Nitrospinota bacterium]
MRKSVLPLVLAVVLFTSPGYAADEGLPNGTPAPEISGQYSGGKEFTLGALSKNTKVLAFFSVRTTTYGIYLAKIAKVERKHPSMQFVAVNVGPDTFAAMLGSVKMLKDRPSTFAVAPASTRESYKFEKFPYTVLLDEDNKVVKSFSGDHDVSFDRLEKALMQKEVHSDMNGAFDELDK